MSCANERCRYAQHCRLKTEAFVDPYSDICPEFCHWEDMAQDAMYEADYKDEDEIPFCEDYDGPEEGEED